MASHCLVRWEDDANQYAVVDTKRSKSVSTLKVGLTTCFEGYERERRRGTILFIGSKKDCSVYGLDVAGDDGQINLSQWSSPPGLREQAEAIGQIIRQSTSAFKRTVSNMSSSSTSSTTTKAPQTKKKFTNNNPNDDERLAKEKSMRQLPLASSITICDTFDTPDECAKQSEQLTSIDAQQPSSSTAANGSANVTTTSSTEINSLHEEIKVLREKVSRTEIVEEENKKLREKVLSLEDELSYLHNTSIRLPDEQSFNYMKSITNTYEQRKADANPKLIELEEKLPCTKMELQQAKCNTNSSKTINNLIKFCYKGVDLKEECYTKLKARDPDLMKNIYNYVQYVHAPKVITKTEFSNAVSLRCRHLRES